jgi:hypothetical protein
VLSGAAVLTLIVPAASAAAPRSRTGAAPVAADHYTPMVAAVQAPPHPVAAADGRVHLAYELLLLNPLPVPITLARVEVLDAAHPGRALADLRGDDLNAALSRLGEGGPGAAAPGQSLSLILDVRLPATARPRTLVHRITVADVPVPILANPFLAARLAVPAEPAVVVAPPLRGPGWLDVGGCCAPADHRTALQPLNGQLFLGQRFAVDIPRIGPDHRFFTGPADQVTSYYAYGAPVLAAAAGDRVRVGQQVGQLGNSGNSDFPHLHFQVMDSPSILASEGLPFVLSAYDSPGSIPPVDEIDPAQPVPVRPILAGHFERVLPMNLQVMDFAAR